MNTNNYRLALGYQVAVMTGRFSFLPAAQVPKRPCQTTTSFFIPLRWSTLYVIHPIPTMMVSISRPQRSSSWLLEKAHPPKQLRRLVVDGQLEPVYHLRWVFASLPGQHKMIKLVFLGPQTLSPTPLTYLPRIVYKSPQSKYFHQPYEGIANELDLFKLAP